MKIELNRITEQERKVIESFGRSAGDITYTVDEAGNDLMVLSEEVASNLTLAIVRGMIENGISEEVC